MLFSLLGREDDVAPISAPAKVRTYNDVICYIWFWAKESTCLELADSFGLIIVSQSWPLRRDIKSPQLTFTSINS